MHQQPTACLEIFRAGTHTSVDGRVISFTPEAVAELAESYDPGLSEAPMVIGHPALDAPAYGWARSLRADNGVLFAEPHQVEAQFAEGVNAGRYKKVSACIYLPASPGNPKPGKHYLRHIGFLGAAAPAVKGLPSAQFAEGDGAVEFSAPLGLLGSTLADMLQRLRDFFVAREGVEAADKILPQWSIRSIESATSESSAVIPAYAAPGGPMLEMSMSDANTQAAAALATRQAELATRESALAKREAATRRVEVVAFADALVTTGRLLPAERDSIVEVLASLPSDLSLSFAEAGAQVSKPAGEVLRGFLTKLPPRVDFAEKSGSDATLASAAFAAPPGMPVDPNGLLVLARAQAYQATHPNVSLVDAIAAASA